MFLRGCQGDAQRERFQSERDRLTQVSGRCEGGEALARAAPCLEVSKQAGQGWGQSALFEGVPAHGGGGTGRDLRCFATQAFFYDNEPDPAPRPQTPAGPECPVRARPRGSGPARFGCARSAPGRPPAPHSQRRSHFIQWYTMVLWCRLFSRHHEERPWIDSIVLVTACSFLSSEASSAPAADEAAAAEEEDEEARPPPPPPAAIFPRCSRPGRAGGGASRGGGARLGGPGGGHGPGD